MSSPIAPASPSNAQATAAARDGERERAEEPSRPDESPAPEAPSAETETSLLPSDRYVVRKAKDNSVSHNPLDRFLGWFFGPNPKLRLGGAFGLTLGLSINWDKLPSKLGALIGKWALPNGLSWGHIALYARKSGKGPTADMAFRRSNIYTVPWARPLPGTDRVTALATQIYEKPVSGAGLALQPPDGHQLFRHRAVGADFNIGTQNRPVSLTAKLASDGWHVGSLGTPIASLFGGFLTLNGGIFYAWEQPFAEKNAKRVFNGWDTKWAQIRAEAEEKLGQLPKWPGFAVVPIPVAESA